MHCVTGAGVYCHSLVRKPPISENLVPGKWADASQRYAFALNGHHFSAVPNAGSFVLRRVAVVPLAGPPSQVNPKCKECQPIDIEYNFKKTFGRLVCNKNDLPEKYGLLTKTG